MGIRLPGSPTPPTMRNPVVRALLAAVCVLLVLMITFRSGPDVSSSLLSKSGIRNHDGTSSEESQSSLGPPLGQPTVKKPLVEDGDIPGSSSPHVPADYEPTSTHAMSCDIDISHLAEIQDRYRLEQKFQYLKRYIRFTRTEGLERKSITKVKQNLLPDKFQTIDITKRYSPEQCAEPLEIAVPKSGLPATVDASDFLFGVSTTYARFMDPGNTPINEWIFWLTDSHGHSNGGKLLLMLLDASDEELQEVANLLGDVGIDVDVYHSDSSVEMAVRYLALVPTLYTHPEASKKKWLVTCDDDTFFPSMHGLREKLNSYDPDTEMYIGTLSEDIGAVERHGSQAFGGAGVFLSLALAAKITDLYSYCTSEEKVLESNSGWGPQGDILLRKCIYENTGTRLTNLWDLWQLDFYEDPAGFYEWGIKPLSLHHYKGGGWHYARPGQFTKIAHTCGEDCSLMRVQTGDDFIVSGFSIAHYPEGVNFDTKQLEGTLHAAPEDRGWNLDFVFGPQRPSLSRTGRKIAWDLQESEVGPDGAITQTYTRKKDDGRWTHEDGQPMSNIDGIIELVWIPA